MIEDPASITEGIRCRIGLIQALRGDIGTDREETGFCVKYKQAWTDIIWAPYVYPTG